MDEYKKSPDVVGSVENGKESLEQLKQDHAAHAAEIAGQKRGRRGPQKGHGGRPRTNPAPGVGIPSASASLFTEQSVEPLVQLPFLFAKAYTKSAAWDLGENETSLLSRTGASALNDWCPGWEPKWVSATAFSLALLTISTQKFMIYLGERNAKKEQDQTTIEVKQA